MPTIDSMLKMSFYVSLVLIVPGPTNTLLLSAGLKAGIRDTWPLVGAEAAGYVVAISAWGFFLLTLVAGNTWMLSAIKLLSAGFIFFLALKMWSRGPKLREFSSGPVSTRDLFLATLTNPKALLFASTLFPLSAFGSASQFACTIGVFLLVLVPIGIGWACLGGLLTSSRTWADRASTLLRCASLVLLMFSATLFYSAFRR
ncbi:LysE family translocator [Burkholderia sp. Ap-962]|uniref:LysE family translocator n=1 Tax=Burkholderia sp. Ap-962 TaxID=2608333 RepID=UPI0031F57EA6